MGGHEYTKLHRQRMGVHLYPTEFLVRTMLGNYPELKMNRQYDGATLLDLGFGDGRNMPLFRNLGVNIYGVEPDPEVCALVNERVTREGIVCDLRVGHNASIPFADRFFDFVVASHSIYYVRDGETFTQNLHETARVMKERGWLVASLPDPENSVLVDSELLGAGHRRITKDPFGLRDGTTFWVGETTEQIAETFGEWFETFSFARFHDDWFGLRVTGWVVVCQKRV